MSVSSLEYYAMPYVIICTINDYAFKVKPQNAKDKEYKENLQGRLLSFFTPLSDVTRDGFFEDDRVIRMQTIIQMPDQNKYHIDKSQSEMVKGCEGLKGHLIVMAPDLVEKGILPRLTLGFQKVTFLSASYESLNDCMRELSLSEQRKVKLVWMDFTESFALLEANIYEAVNSKMTPKQTYALLTQSIERLVKENFKSAVRKIEPGDYVISSLVSSQLYYLLKEYCQKHFDYIWKSYRFNEEEKMAYRQFKILMAKVLQAKYCRDLHYLVKDTGRLYLADTTRDELNNLDILDNRFFTPLFDLFDSRKHQSWNWAVVDPASAMAINYKIEQFILVKRQLTNQVSFDVSSSSDSDNEENFD